MANEIFKLESKLRKVHAKLIEIETALNKFDKLFEDLEALQKRVEKLEDFASNAAYVVDRFTPIR